MWHKFCNFLDYLKNIDGAMHFIIHIKYDTNLAEDSSDTKWILFRS